MPIELTWISTKVLHIYYSGHITSEEIEQSTLTTSGDSRLDDLRYLVCDWSDSNSEAILTEEEIQRNVIFMGAMARSNPTVKFAVVLNQNNEHRWEMANKLKALAESIPWDVKCFETLKEANVWLGIE